MRTARRASSSAAMQARIHPDPFPQLRVAGRGNARAVCCLDPGYHTQRLLERRASEIDVSPTMLPWSTPPWHGSQDSVLRIQQHWVDAFEREREPETSGATASRPMGWCSARTSPRGRARRVEPRSSRRTRFGPERYERDSGEDRPWLRPLRHRRATDVRTRAARAFFRRRARRGSCVPVKDGRLPPKRSLTTTRCSSAARKVSDAELGGESGGCG